MHNRTLRNNLQLHIPGHRTSLFQRSFTYNCATVYNKISDNLKMMTVQTFYAELKKELLDSQ